MATPSTSHDAANAVPHHLASNGAQGLVRPEPVAQFELGTMRNFVYLILDWASKKAAIVDPQKDLDTPMRALESHGFALESCLLTHSHHDHVAGVPGLLARMPDLPIHLHSADAFRLKNLPPQTCLRPLQDGEIIRVGTLEVQAHHTPGHSPGELCYSLATDRGRFLFTGDTLFIRDCGATHFEGGSDEEMFASLKKIKALPADSVILPGHHYAMECASTLARELETSPPLRCRSVDDLRNLP